MHRELAVAGAALIVVALLGACSRGASPDSGATGSAGATTTEASAAPPTDPTSTSTVPPTTAPAPAPPVSTTAPAPPVLRSGSSGPEVLELQQHLVALGFWIPGPDGVFRSTTAQAVMAFQKWHGLGRDGVAGPHTLAALDAATPAAALEAGDHVEIDLARQVLIVVRGPETLVFNTSTGRQGWRTPAGRFTVTRQIDGVRVSEFGELYRPKYFTGGIALHGSPSIPAYAASHGCARLHDTAIDLIWDFDLVPVGTPVWVR